MSETEAILKHDDPSVSKWAVPVPLGSTPERVAEGWAAAGWSLHRAADADDPVSADPETEYPKLSASKAEWVEFAVAHGLAEADAEALTRDGLRDMYLPAEPASE